MEIATAENISEAVASAKRIDLWFVFPNEINDFFKRHTYDDILSELEQLEAEKYYFAKDKQRHVMTRVLVRSVLSKYLAIPPESLIFKKNSFGKPAVANLEASAKEISFNISHTSGLILLAVTRDNRLGIDLENKVARTAPLDVAERYFLPEERIQLNSQVSHLRPELFFRIWTLKEAYAKARGLGLTIPMNQYGFSLASRGEIEFLVTPALNDIASLWNFWQFELFNKQIISVCSERISEGIQTIAAKRWFPLNRDESLELTWMAQSRYDNFISEDIQLR